MSVDKELWIPPDNPDPRSIFHEARADARAGKYDQALQKHVWFHENALQYRDSLFGVRLSFALADWSRLGKLYPPALEKLKETRDETKQRIAAEGYSRISLNDFCDLVAINQDLNEDADTVEVFRCLDERDTNRAKRLYRIAESALIRANEHTFREKYGNE